VLQTGTRLVQGLLLAIVVSLACGLPGMSRAQAAQALLNTEVAPAKWKAVRLKNLPKGAAVGLSVATSGTVDLIFVHQDELKRFPAAVNPLFQGTVERKLEFSVVIPASGDYFVIFDNRRGTQAQKVKILIRAERPRSANLAPPAPAKRKNETEL
jgi:hypothetical protein